MTRMFGYYTCGGQCWPLETELNEGFLRASSHICTRTGPKADRPPRLSAGGSIEGGGRRQAAGKGVAGESRLVTVTLRAAKGF